MVEGTDRAASEEMKEPVTRPDDGRYGLVTPIHYTLTRAADHSEDFGPDTASRSLRRNG
jgi:hypothetical protein